MGRYNMGASTNILHIFSDCVFGILSFFLAIIVTGQGHSGSFARYALVCLAFMVVFILSNKESRLYNVTTFFYADRIIRYVSKSFLIATGVISTMLFYVGHADVDREFYVVFLILTYILMLVSAFAVRHYGKKTIKLAPRTLLVGEIDKFKNFERYLSKSNVEVNNLGYLSMEERNDSRYLGTVKNLEQIIHEKGVDQVYFMHRKNDSIDIQPYIDICMQMGVTVRIIMNSYRAEGAQSYVSSVGTYPVVTYHRVSLNASSRALKRVIDIIGSLVGIILSSPIMLITALAILIESKGKGNIIFKQERVGLNGRHFFMYKFRSMCVNAEQMKAQLMKDNQMNSNLMFKMENDPRITKVGRIIRKTSIDELPQFFNVLKGDMSLVGTRPPTLDEVNHYERNHWRRMSIKPGITGMWQVSGRSAITDFDEIVELDTEYIDKWDVLLDFQIIFKTALQVVVHKGAY